MATVKIERTGKGLKLLLLISVFISIGGVFVAYANPPVGFVTICAGVGMFIFTKFLIWWFHG